MKPMNKQKILTVAAMIAFGAIILSHYVTMGWHWIPSGKLREQTTWHDLGPGYDLSSEQVYNEEGKESSQITPTRVCSSTIWFRKHQREPSSRMDASNTQPRHRSMIDLEQHILEWSGSALKAPCFQMSACRCSCGRCSTLDCYSC